VSTLRDLVGLPWTPEHNCWWLVREAFLVRWGIVLPTIAIAEPDENNVRAIKQAVQAGAIRPIADQPPVDGDIVLMRSLTKLHCGLVVRANGRTGVLHSSHGVGVVWQPWVEAIAGMTPELWRRAS
jgi:hypothetical protein